MCALAELYVLDGKDAKADTVHRQLLQVAPNDAAAHNNYAAFLQRAGKLFTATKINYSLGKLYGVIRSI